MQRRRPGKPSRALILLALSGLALAGCVQHAPLPGRPTDDTVRIPVPHWSQGGHWREATVANGVPITSTTNLTGFSYTVKGYDAFVTLQLRTESRWLDANGTEQASRRTLTIRQSDGALVQDDLVDYTPPISGDSVHRTLRVLWDKPCPWFYGNHTARWTQECPARLDFNGSAADRHVVQTYTFTYRGQGPVSVGAGSFPATHLFRIDVDDGIRRSAQQVWYEPSVCHDVQRLAPGETTVLQEAHCGDVA